MSTLVVTTMPLRERLNYRLVLAFFAIYVIWGSTFLAIRTAVLLVPPWFCAGIRFFTAGTILFVLRGCAGRNGRRCGSGGAWRLSAF